MTHMVVDDVALVPSDALQIQDRPIESIPVGTPLARQSVAVFWLVVIHGLALVTLALYRQIGVAPAATDALLAGVVRSSICLLALWLFLGTHSFSFRAIGTLASLACLMTLLLRLMPSGFLMQRGLWFQRVWTPEDWPVFFGPTGPGSVLILVPIVWTILLHDVALWRVFQRHHRATSPQRTVAVGADTAKSAIWWRGQFRLSTLVISLLAACAGLAAWVAIPYDGWLDGVQERWALIFTVQDSSAGRALAASIPTVVVCLLAIHFSTSVPKLLWGCATTIAVALAITLPFDTLTWDSSVALGFHRELLVSASKAPEAVITLCAGLLMLISISLYRFYDHTFAVSSTGNILLWLLRQSAPPQESAEVLIVDVPSATPAQAAPSAASGSALAPPSLPVGQ